MKGLISCTKKNLFWTSEFFNKSNPYFLTIVNKPVLEYYIDLLSKLGIKEIRILMGDPDRKIYSYFDSGTKWGVNLSYGLINEEDSFTKILNKNKGFCKDSDLFVISGLQFIFYNKNSDYENIFLNEKNSIICKKRNGFLAYLKKEDQFSELEKNTNNNIDHSGFNWEIRDINSITDFYTLSMDVLSKFSGNFILPGYNNEKDVFVGQKVIIPGNIKFEKPLMIGDNVKFEGINKIGEKAIIGNNIIIDKATSIKKSIIFDNTYIGSDLEIDKKIVFFNKLIDPLTKTSISIIDGFLISSIDKNIFKNFFGKIIDKILSILMYIILTIPFLFLFLFTFPFYKKIFKSERIIINKNKIKKILIPGGQKQGFLSKLYRALLLDKMPFLYNVLIGDFVFIGNKPLIESQEGFRILKELPRYYPGVFNYSESISGKTDEMSLLMDELYFSNNNNFKFRSKIFFKTKIKRLFRFI
jgi:NDP-sugar pyrophosphorylase family protein